MAKMAGESGDAETKSPSKVKTQPNMFIHKQKQKYVDETINEKKKLLELEIDDV